MNKEIFRQGNTSDTRELKEAVIKSRLPTDIKCDFLDYLGVQKNDPLPALRRLVYDFLEAGNAMKKAEGRDNLSDWVHSVVNELAPSIKGYSKQQIDLVVALLLYEQSIREGTYNDLFIKFTEVYKNEGGVF
jgi:hypothetical protein